MHMERVRNLVAEGELHTQVYKDLEHTRPAVVHIVEEEGIGEHHIEGDTVVAEGIVVEDTVVVDIEGGIVAVVQEGYNPSRRLDLVPFGATSCWFKLRLF